MGLFGNLLYVFTPYTDWRERAVGRFFKGLREHGNQRRTRAKLGKLLQRDIAVINLWTEYRYKGYKYLKKSQRRKLYANLELIALDFDQYLQTHQRPLAAVEAHIQRLAPGSKPEPGRLALIRALMEYFSPRRGSYIYRESSSFGRLLRDPAQEKLIGDCNQIVTLYIYLYSRYFDIDDLQVRVLPEHVALHYGGVDIEATNGTFANYASKKGSALLPIEEIVSINLLDTNDSYLTTHKVAAEDLLQSSRLAFILSHNRDLVTHNLHAAYSTLINTLMKRDDYGRALTFAVASRDAELLNIVGHNGAVFALRHHDFSAARRFAKHAAKRDELTRNSWHAEAINHYNNHHYQDAIKAFKRIGDKPNIQRCYEALFFEEQAKLGSDITTATIRQHAKTIGRMRSYAKKSGNKKLAKHADSLRRYL